MYLITVVISMNLATVLFISGKKKSCFLWFGKIQLNRDYNYLDSFSNNFVLYFFKTFTNFYINLCEQTTIPVTKSLFVLFFVQF